MPDPSAPGPGSPAAPDLLRELERLVPDLPTTTLLELAARLDELVATEQPQPDQVERALIQLLDAG